MCRLLYFTVVYMGREAAVVGGVQLLIGRSHLLAAGTACIWGASGGLVCEGRLRAEEGCPACQQASHSWSITVPSSRCSMHLRSVAERACCWCCARPRLPSCGTPTMTRWQTVRSGCGSYRVTTRTCRGELRVMSCRGARPWWAVWRRAWRLGGHAGRQGLSNKQDSGVVGDAF